MSPNRDIVLDALRDQIPPNEFRALESWGSRECFFDYQLDWLYDQSDLALYNKSRQIGISHTTSAWAVLRGAYFGETTTIISVGQREAEEVLVKAAKHAHILERLGSKWSTGRANKSEINFKSGGKIIALPASSGGRSYSGNVMLDEYAYVRNQEQLWDGASPVTMHGYALRVVSTPNGVGDKFWELYESAKKPGSLWSLHETPIDRAEKDGMLIDWKKLWESARQDERLFNQFYRCQFLDGAEQYIPTKLLMAALEDKTWQHISAAPLCVAGLDIGGEHDLTALVVVRVTADGRRWVQTVETCKRSDWDEQMAMIQKNWKQYRWSRLAVDSTGLGTVPAQQLQKVFGTNVVEAYKFTTQSKEVLATNLYTHFAQSIAGDPYSDPLKRKTVPLIALPSTDRDLYTDLASIKRIVSESGGIKYDAPRTVRGHADRAWALALALYAASRAQPVRNLGNLPPA